MASMRWVRPDFTTVALAAACSSSTPARWSRAGSRSRRTITAAATWIAVGNTSLDDCDAFTSSFGCTGRPSDADARWAITSLAFMFVDVPEPVWNVSTGNWSSHRPSATCCGGGDDHGGHVALDHAQVGVDLRGRRLDRAEGVDELRLDGPARHREVLHRPLRLGAPPGRGRDPDLAHRVVLDPDVVLGHAPTVGPDLAFPSMTDLAFTELLPLGPDDTPYRLLTTDGVSTVEAAGRTFLQVEPEALTLLAREAFRDIAHWLRPAHLRQLRRDPRRPRGVAQRQVRRPRPAEERQHRRRRRAARCARTPAPRS